MKVLSALFVVLALVAMTEMARATEEAEALASATPVVLPLAAPPGMHPVFVSPEASQVSLDEEREVEAVTQICMTVHENAGFPVCGVYCAPRREGMPDYRATVMDEASCREVAEALVYGSAEHGFPLPEALSIMQTESGFRRYAIGRDRECGLFQQRTDGLDERYSSVQLGRDYSAEVYPYGSVDTVLSEDDAKCAFLLYPDNAVAAYAAHRDEMIRRCGPENWIRCYNGYPSERVGEPAHAAEVRARARAYQTRVVEVAALFEREIHED